MLIKVNDELLDFNDVVEVEKQARLFQDVSGVYGDFSYSFSIPITDRNLSILDLKSINQRLSFTDKKDCILLSDSGEELYGGFIRVESIGEAIECSFYSGNNSWFEATRKKLREYNFKRLEKEFNYANVSASWSLTNGVVWPLVDKGTLHKRDSATMYDNDWQPFVYVKDAINLVLAQSGGIKIEGDLLRDPLYNSLVTTNGGISALEDIIDKQSAYIGKSSNQSITTTTYQNITFTDTSDPYAVSQHWNTSTSTFTLPSNWISGSVEFNLRISTLSTFIGTRIKVLRNGVTIYEKSFAEKKTITDTITINNGSQGDTITIQAKRINPTTTFDGSLWNYSINVGSFIKIKPIKLRRVYPQQLMPDIDANEFISTVFTQFNVLSVYDYKNKVINTRLLENVKKQPAIDLSEYVSNVTNHDFSELIGDYAKSSRFLYGEASDDFTEQYNAANPDLFYGGGAIVIDNDFLEDSSDFVELDFFAPYQVPVDWLGFRLPLLEMNEFSLGGSIEYTKVSESNGYAVFSWVGTLANAPFTAGDLIKVTDKQGTDEYNGIYIVTAISQAGNRVYLASNDILFSATSSGTIELVNVVDLLNEDQITIANVPSTALSEFTDTSSIKWGSNTLTTVSLGYFWLPQVKKSINRIKSSLTFGRINDEEYYQRSLLETYYPVTNQVLNDPVMITAEMYLPESVFRSIDFLSPVRLNTEKFNGLFLVNRITGYNGQHMSCEMQLIKISNAELTTEDTGVIVADAPPASDPPADPTYTYRAALYACDGCALVTDPVRVVSTIPLTIGKFYQVVGSLDSTNYMAEISALGASGKVPVYELVFSTEYSVCSTCVTP